MFIQNYIQYHFFPPPSLSHTHIHTNYEQDFKVIVLIFYLIGKR